MVKLLLLIVLALLVWRLVAGRWPWQPKPIPAKLRRASALLGVAPTASRQEILEAHRRLMATVHPDRGGSSELVHEANAARDALLAALPLAVRDR